MACALCENTSEGNICEGCGEKYPPSPSCILCRDLGHICYVCYVGGSQEQPPQDQECQYCHEIVPPGSLVCGPCSTKGLKPSASPNEVVFDRALLIRNLFAQSGSNIEQIRQGLTWKLFGGRRKFETLLLKSDRTLEFNWLSLVVACGGVSVRLNLVALGPRIVLTRGSDTWSVHTVEEAAQKVDELLSVRTKWSLLGSI